MRNFGRWLGVIVIVVVVIGFSFVACKKDSLDGTTWKGGIPDEAGEFVLKFNNPDYTLTRPYDAPAKGSYAISGVTITMTWTDDFDAKITGTLAGNTLSINADGEIMEFTKQ
jgi:hypothetical protein